jgi:hypothetical protein
LYDGRGISNRQNQPTSFVSLHFSPCHGGNHARPLSDQNSPVLSIRDEDEIYQTPSPDAHFRGASASPEHITDCHEFEACHSYRTPRAPSIRPIDAPLLELDDCAGSLDSCILTKAKLDHTFSHLRLCFNNDFNSIQTEASASGQITTAASTRTTPKKIGKSACVMQ